VEKARFLELLDKYMAGEATLEEEQQLLNFYGSFNKTSKPGAIDPDLENKMLERLMENVSMTAVSPKKNTAYMWRKLSVAAAFLLVSTIAIYFYYNSKVEDPAGQFVEINVQNDIAPGANKAILTLADGAMISLDDAANGFVASQGNISITKTDEGQIVYKRRNTGEINSFNAGAINTIQTPKGGRYKISLPDGSKVWLNSASMLRYPTAFTGTERKVSLKGEAYFEIAKKEIPFRVESNNQIVEVLGTQFNINSYEDEDFIKTTLLEGSVRVILNTPQSSQPNMELLKPGEQSLTNAHQAGIRVENTDTEKAVAWKNGYFKFKNTPIRDIMREIERWYDVELIYENNIPNDEFTGFVSNDVKISGVLKILEQSGGIKFTVLGRKIKIKSIQ
jgi:transmembrane sensor